MAAPQNGVHLFSVCHQINHGGASNEVTHFLRLEKSQLKNHGPRVSSRQLPIEGENYVSFRLYIRQQWKHYNSASPAMQDYYILFLQCKTSSLMCVCLFCKEITLVISVDITRCDVWQALVQFFKCFFFIGMSHNHVCFGIRGCNVIFLLL